MDLLITKLGAHTAARSDSSFEQASSISDQTGDSYVHKYNVPLPCVKKKVVIGGSQKLAELP